MCTSAGRGRGNPPFPPGRWIIPLPSAQLPDITEIFLVCHCRDNDDCHTNALQDFGALHGMAFGFKKVVMIGQQGYGAKHALSSWQSPFWQGMKGSNSEAFLKCTRWAVERTDVVEDPDSLRDIFLMRDGRAHQRRHGDFLASAIPSRANMRRGNACEPRRNIKEEGYILDFCSVAGTCVNAPSFKGYRE